MLVVDDDTALAEMLGIVLRGEGFDPVFCGDGAAALERVPHTRPDLVLLDLMLPGMDGIDVCRADPRGIGRADRHAHRQDGHPRRRARPGVRRRRLRPQAVQAQGARRPGAGPAAPRPAGPRSAGDRRRRHRRRRARGAPRRRQSISLTPLEFDLLVALARKPWQVFTREVLLEQVWGYRHAADTRLVNVHVQRLRSKIERDPESPEIVVTVRGVGYKAGPPLPRSSRRPGP